MKQMRRRLLTAFYAPIVVGVLRIVVTVGIFIFNPLALPWPFFQFISLGVLAWSLFSYVKLYRDSDPIVSLLLPTIAHFLLIFAFQRRVVLIPFIPTLVIDLVYLVLKGLKAVMFPFEIEGEEDADLEFFEDEEEQVNA